MTPIDPTDMREFLEAIIAAFAVLGGLMAYCSGYSASTALAQGDLPSEVARQIDEGLALGFTLGAPGAIITLIIMGWSW